MTEGPHKGRMLFKKSVFQQPLIAVQRFFNAIGKFCEELPGLVDY